MKNLDPSKHLIGIKLLLVTVSVFLFSYAWLMFFGNDKFGTAFLMAIPSWISLGIILDFLQRKYEVIQFNKFIFSNTEQPTLGQALYEWDNPVAGSSGNLIFSSGIIHFSNKSSFVCRNKSAFNKIQGKCQQLNLNFNPMFCSMGNPPVGHRVV